MISSVRKALAILTLFTPAQPTLTAAEISAGLGLARGASYHLLATLRACGLVEKCRDNRYALGRGVVALTPAVLVNVELRDRTASILSDLAGNCQQSIGLAVRDGDDCLCIYASESPRRLLARTAVGSRTRLHWTALGKAILALLPEGDVCAIVRRVGLHAATSHTITDLDCLLMDLAQTRARGYAIENQECETGVLSVGAPVLDSAGNVAGSIAIWGDGVDLPPERLGDLSVSVVRAAQEASHRMGYVPRTWSSSPHVAIRTTAAPAAIDRGHCPPLLV